MPTTAQTFFPSSTEQDFAAGGEVDVRKLSEALGPSDNTTTVTFDPAAGQDIALDPYSTVSTSSAFDSVGWAINRLGADGMGSVSDAKRIIPSGSWTLNGRLGAGAALTGTYRMRVRLYRVAADGTRMLLFGPVDSAGVSPNVAGVSVSVSTSQPKFTFEADETLLVSYSIEKTAASAVSEVVEWRLNDAIGNDCEIGLPAAIATDFFRTQTDPLGMLDSRARDVERELIEAEGLLDLAGVVRARIISHALALSDAQSLGFGKFHPETFTLIDATSDVENAIRQIADDGGLTDITLRHRSFTKLPIQAIIDQREEIFYRIA